MPRALFGNNLRFMQRTVLIVDDHAVFRSAARALLEADGFRVVGDAADGGAGLAAARELHPDVVLLDVRLPDVDGFTVAAEMTGAEGAPAVVVTSSSDDPRYPDLALRSGAVGFVAKHDLCGSEFHGMLS
ncbi:MAG: putative two-component system response regulator [uncultured Solirubrobacteraceae bacterium]|uniref:Putative two-component system response regulator n=1 Tax=uncultured Solirubrobacteraceae bacterium TaxID=1162706 RepID=A0A6J4RIP6_9ACTN|nr:MAG: putative two-component system response regulator [uncultured Solirubrobacteraceae bacterium]